ncbi:MAG TPA: hypothetical protein VF665_10975, partial [Longimicrobium sp.]|uniref:hypothetical protein n=1 Tax=Longimicrobium sp. TaxID=2029185 RepID=UPI002ED77E17
MPLVLNPSPDLLHALQVEAINTECAVEELSEALLHVAMVLLAEYDPSTLPEAAVRILRDRELVTSEAVAEAFDDYIR